MVAGTDEKTSFCRSLVLGGVHFDECMTNGCWLYVRLLCSVACSNRNELAAQLTLDDDKTRNAIHRKKVKQKQKRLGLKWKKSEKNRYNMLLFAELAVERKADLYQLCTWGCGEWMQLWEIKDHCDEKCPKRMLPCELGCGLYLRSEFWAKVRLSHEENECSKRMVLCPQGCGRQIVSGGGNQDGLVYRWTDGVLNYFLVEHLFFFSFLFLLFSFFFFFNLFFRCLKVKGQIFWFPFFIGRLLCLTVSDCFHFFS